MSRPQGGEGVQGEQLLRMGLVEVLVRPIPHPLPRRLSDPQGSFELEVRRLGNSARLGFQASLCPPAPTLPAFKGRHGVSAGRAQGAQTLWLGQAGLLETV